MVDSAYFQTICLYFSMQGGGVGSSKSYQEVVLTAKFHFIIILIIFSQIMGL